MKRPKSIYNRRYARGKATQESALAPVPELRYSLARVITILIAACVLFNIPFITQAFHIDDSLSVFLARNILQHPLDPYGFSVVYNGVMQGFHQFYANPPLSGYLLALPMALFGEGEVPLHLYNLIWVFFAALFMFLIARRFLSDDADALAAALFLVVSPAVSVMCHTIMPDTALLAFYLGAVYLFFRAGEGRSIAHYLLSGIFASAACSVRYTAFSLLPVLILLIVVRKEHRTPAALIPIFLPLLAFYAWCQWATSLYTADYWKTIFSLETGSSKLPRIGLHMLANISYAGGASLFPASLLCAVGVRHKKTALIVFGISAVISFWFCRIIMTGLGHTPFQAALFFIFSFCFLSFLGAALTHIKPWTHKDALRIILIAWILVLLVFNALFLHTAVKYHMLALAPIIILFLLMAKCAFSKMYTAIVAGTIALTALISLLVAASDFRYANCYKEFAGTITSLYGGQGKVVYYTGHWGWDYYMMKRSAKPLLSDGSEGPAKGDIVVIPSVPWPQPIPAGLKSRLSLREKIAVENSLPIWTMNGPAKAFFYANYNYPRHQGVLPYSLMSSGPLETFYVLEVQ